MQSMLSGQTVKRFRRCAVQLLRITGCPASTRCARATRRRQVHQRHPGNDENLPRRRSRDLQRVRAAHEEANAFIKREPVAAAEIDPRLTNDKKNSADDLVTMITDPDIDYTTAPANLMTHAEFLHKVGRIKHLPTSWRTCSSPRPTISTAPERDQLTSVWGHTPSKMFLRSSKRPIPVELSRARGEAGKEEFCDGSYDGEDLRAALHQARCQ